MAGQEYSNFANTGKRKIVNHIIMKSMFTYWIALREFST